ncbi:MAG: hypothetical protein GY772_27080 [bacterium]|nr:hypothetical protein [bacterium]
MTYPLVPNLSTVVKVSSSRQPRLQSAVTWQSMSKQATTVAMTVARKVRSAVAMRAAASVSETEGSVTWSGVAAGVAAVFAATRGDARLGAGREAAAAVVAEAAVAERGWSHAPAECLRLPDGGGPDAMAMSESMSGTLSESVPSPSARGDAKASPVVGMARKLCGARPNPKRC